MLPWNVEDLALDEGRFAGVVRIFPLPDLIMFPNVMQPLHVFEQRYRDLLNDALDGDGLIAMAALEPGWEVDYEGRPAVYPYACLGKIVAHHRLEDGRYNLMLLGSRRVRIVEEAEPSRTYRQASAEILHDCYRASGEARRPELQQRLIRQFTESLPTHLLPNEQIGALSAADLPLGVLADLAAFVLPLQRRLKVRLLGECDADLRAELVLAALEQSDFDSSPSDESSDPFPPHFSSN
ncbi:MAG: LON peptidase substrate-binding domain-containing protein [Planctomycetota bacterium]